LSALPNAQLCHKERQTDQSYAKKHQKDKGSSTVLPHYIGKLPEIAETNGRTCGS
jgi:hypothetical protein